jgi:hypothetical protein
VQFLELPDPARDNVGCGSKTYVQRNIVIVPDQQLWQPCQINQKSGVHENSCAQIVICRDRGLLVLRFGRDAKIQSLAHQRPELMGGRWRQARGEAPLPKSPNRAAAALRRNISDFEATSTASAHNIAKWASVANPILETDITPLVDDLAPPTGTSIETHSRLFIRSSACLAPVLM